jgi:hypothetical protein
MALSLNIGCRPGRAPRALSGLIFAPLALLASIATAQTSQITSTVKPVSEGPRLRILELEKDFGVVTRGQILEATHILENIGGQPLRILRVKPG